jgi:hypothetical protein
VKESKPLPASGNSELEMGCVKALGVLFVGLPIVEGANAAAHSRTLHRVHCQLVKKKKKLTRPHARHQGGDCSPFGSSDLLCGVETA